MAVQCYTRSNRDKQAFFCIFTQFKVLRKPRQACENMLPYSMTIAQIRTQNLRIMRPWKAKYLYSIFSLLRMLILLLHTKSLWGHNEAKLQFGHIMLTWSR